MIGMRMGLGLGAPMQAVSGESLPTEGGIEYGGYIYHIFEADGELEVLADVDVEILLVAGGGSGATGGTDAGGGAGGAGGLILAQKTLIPGIYDIDIGAGGVAGTTVNNQPGVNGQNSVFKEQGGDNLFVAIGGGRGGIYDSGDSDQALKGGSGGGVGGRGSSSGGIGGFGEQKNNPAGEGFGNNGGSRVSYFLSGTGGGGAGGYSGDNTAAGGLGKDLSDKFPLWGKDGVFAQGGEGGIPNTRNGLGGGSENKNGLDGTGGGGGGTMNNAGVYAGNGGSGIVIVRYAI